MGRRVQARCPRVFGNELRGENTETVMTKHRNKHRNSHVDIVDIVDQESLFDVIFWPQKLFLTYIMYKSRQDSDTYVTNYRNNVIKQRVYSNYKIQKY